MMVCYYDRPVKRVNKQPAIFAEDFAISAEIGLIAHESSSVNVLCATTEFTTQSLL